VPLADRSALLKVLAPPLDALLTSQFVDEFVSMEQRYVLRDWGPAELDGGRFCEVLSRILYHLDSGSLNRGKSLDDCLKYIDNEQVNHKITPRHDALHFVRVLRAVYKFRSQRGAVHISPSYTPNHMDSRLMLECVRWCFMEALRLFGQGDRENIARRIRELLQFDVPCIAQFDDQLLVQRTDLTAEEEILILLHQAGEMGMSRRDLGQYARVSAASVTNTLRKLTARDRREVVQLINGNFRLTDLGTRRVVVRLSPKLMLPDPD
jgi:DNA-binding MarR family transcriptional regulator